VESEGVGVELLLEEWGEAGDGVELGFQLLESDGGDFGGVEVLALALLLAGNAVERVLRAPRIQAHEVARLSVLASRLELR
jgi:hypothetical protein